MHSYARWLSSRLWVTVGILAVLTVGVVSYVNRWEPWHIPAANAADTDVCQQSDVVIASSTVPLLDPANIAQHYPVAKSISQVAARVNGEDISALQLEMRTVIAVKQHQQSLSGLPAGAEGVAAELNKTPNQLGKDMLNKLIEERLLLQEGRRLGLIASRSDAQAMAQHQLDQFATLPSSDPAKITFEAYLCANRLSVSNFASNPYVLQGYQEALTIAAVRYHIVMQLPPSKREDAAAVQVAVNAKVQQLRQSAKIEVYVPAQ